ncbi:MobC family plasmid mobilization relaxosome protein [Mucilaginibacter glaciei]|uniref:MobC family plasmid mobilization relaxosome protein n=1 Tax=Mucilaginibacter glaciei TaxID=2772109 RepID=A0A926S4I6_9SPHI|nr:MobC family plasmid mobilization relaxosome protein [Mucilaginibacter glaciei]MBD1395304.1 MobC family plasmid mobilization relaxosome protein [Mucilaginibacter glaciei]
MSRPRKDKEHKLSKVIVFRLTEAELQKLEGYSETCGKAIGVMVRDKLFTGSFPRQVMPKSDHQLYAELNRIGNNINQLARRANSGFMYKGHTQLLLDLLNKLLVQQQLVVNHLLDGRR